MKRDRELQRLGELAAEVLAEPGRSGAERELASGLAGAVEELLGLRSAARDVSASYERYDGPRWSAIEELEHVMRES